MPESSTAAETISEKIQRALDLYDGKIKNQPKKISKGFFAKMIPEPDFIKEIRNLKKDIDNNRSSEEAVIKSIGALIENDSSYPTMLSSSAVSKAKLILDFLLFNGNYYTKKYRWEFLDEKLDDQDKSGYYFEFLIATNLLHLGNFEATQDVFLNSANQLKLNQALITGTANASVESLLCILTHCNHLVDLSVCSDIAGMNNNALMLALAKGRQHQDSDKKSNKKMNDIIDLFLENATVSSVVNHQDQFGMTALHLAILHGDIESVQKLISLGADPTITNNSGKTAYDYTRISYSEANEHLAAYTVARDRDSYLTFDKDLSEKLNDYLSPTHTMIKKSKWSSNLSECRSLLEPVCSELQNLHTGNKATR